MYKITDVVEVGYYSKNDVRVGGTIEISLDYGVYDLEYFKEALEVIDNLDHCLISDNEELIDFSERYFYFEEITNIFEVILSVLYEFIKKPIECTIKINKESYTNILYPYNKIVKYNVKG